MSNSPQYNADSSVLAVEKILNYKFKNKNLLVEALTHSSCTTSPSYERLEFVGDAVLGLAFTNFVFLTYQTLDPGTLSLIRAANISTENLARIAIRNGLHLYVRHNALALERKVGEFVRAVELEDEAAIYGGTIKAPKVLADIVESVVAAIYVDCGFDLIFLWQVIRILLEPIITFETLSLQPVTMLHELCQKQGQQLDIKHWRNNDRNICSIYVDGKLLATGTSDHKDIAKLTAAKEALTSLNHSAVNSSAGVICEVNDNNEVEVAKQKLHELCSKKKWSKPSYRVEKDVGLDHEKKFVCSVEIETTEVKLHMVGDEKSRLRDAENSAASLMIHSLVDSSYV